jgi:hypothetical protein
MTARVADAITIVTNGNTAELSRAESSLPLLLASCQLPHPSHLLSGMPWHMTSFTLVHTLLGNLP